MVLRPEHELLLCCSHINREAKTIEWLKNILQKKIDWDYLIQIAINHGVMPLLYQSLSETYAEIVPKTAFIKLQEKFCANVGHNLALTSKLFKILELLETHNIPVIPFKGPILAASAYENLALRQISDLDLLVKERNFQKAVDLLIFEGYQLTLQLPWEFHLTSKDGSYSIDLHREFFSKYDSYSFNSTYAWEHLETFSLMGTIVPNLSPEICLVIVLINGNKDCWRSLSRICDVAALIRTHSEMNWHQVMEQTEKMGCKRLSLLGFLLAHNLLGVSFPDFIWRQMQSDSVANILALQVEAQLFSTTEKSIETVEERFFYIKTREHWQDKARIFLGLMHLSGWLHPTSKDRDVIPLPVSLSFLSYLIRPIRVFLKYRHLLFNYFNH